VGRFVAIVLIASVLALVPTPPRAGAARTWVVQVGASAADQAEQALRFLPGTITIDVGDTVQWKLAASDHTIYFPAGQKPPDLIISGKTKGQLLWNPAVMFASPRKTYDGSGPLSGGALVHDPGAPKSYTLTFTKAGTYRYLCMFHPGMEGTVVVQPAGSPYPKTQADYEQIAAAEAHAALAKAAALRASNKPIVTAAGGHHDYTLELVGSVKDGVTVYRFPAQTLTIDRGDTVTWAMQDPTELHTVSFGVGNHPFDIVTMQPRPQGPPLPVVTPATIRPAGGPVHRGAGLYNSGFLMTEPPGVRRYTLTFTQRGTFKYICAVHDDFGMQATVVVR
jgi:plastocyanin